VGFVVARNWKQIRQAAEPVVQRIGRRSTEALEQGRERIWAQREKIEDMIAEVREKDASRRSAATVRA
jgi:hypothetical protein